MDENQRRQIRSGRRGHMDVVDARAADLDERADRLVAARNPPVADARRADEKQDDVKQKTGCG
jgi:hypothetical protein